MNHNKTTLALVLSVWVLFLSIDGAAACRCPLAVALPQYAVFVRHDMTARTSDIEGSLAVGGSCTLLDYSVGGSLTPPVAGTPVVVVYGDLSWTRGTAFNGDVVVHGSATVESVNVPKGSLAQQVPSSQMPLNIEAEFQRVVDISSSSAALSATGSTHEQWGSITLSGDDAAFNVVYLDALQLWSANRLVISAPASSMVLVNINGVECQFANMGVELQQGLAPTNVVFNFYEAKSVAISGVGVRGSIVAPLAHVDFNNANVDGSIYCDSFSGTGETHWYPPVVGVPPCDSVCGADCSVVSANNATEWHLAFNGWEYSTVRNESVYHYSLTTLADDPTNPICAANPDGHCESLVRWDLAFMQAFAARVKLDQSYAPLTIGEDPEAQYDSLPFVGILFSIPSGTSTLGTTIDFTLVLSGKVCYQDVLFVVKGATKCASGIIPGPNMLAPEDACATPPTSEGGCDYSMVSIRVPMSQLCD